MKKYIQWSYYKTISYFRNMKYKQMGGAKVYGNSLKEYAERTVLGCDDANQYIFELISSGKPFMAGRFGATELLNMGAQEFGDIELGKYDRHFYFNHLCEWSGFFPNDIQYRRQYCNLMKDSCKEIDVMAIWFQPFEDYFIRKFTKKNITQTYLFNFEPWAGNVHWSAALKGKKVLIIHPFAETIMQQYKRREQIFPDTDILPEFELKTLKAVQTIAGVKDPRFETWFDALEWMYKEAMKIDFDIAIIGCGAFGFPLAAKIKRTGKQAIHLAGATQILFGIKGKRWEDNPDFDYVQKWFNEYWIRPGDSENVEGAKKVEGGCYW